MPDLSQQPIPRTQTSIMHKENTHISRQTGATLLEVLIAVLVLSFGLLGMAGLQTTSLRINQSALERSQAIFETYAIVEAMRADRNNASSGRYNIALNAAAPAGSNFADATRREWRNRIANNMGIGATGAIACNDLNCTITIQWNDERAAAGEGAARREAAQTRQIVTEVQL